MRGGDGGGAHSLVCGAALGARPAGGDVLQYRASAQA